MAARSKRLQPEALQFFREASTRLRKMQRAAVRAPDTALQQVLQEMKHGIEARTAADPDWLLKVLRELADMMDAAGPIDEATVRARLYKDRMKVCEDPIAAALLSLIDRAHQRFRGSPMLIQPNPVGFPRACIRSAAAFTRAVRTGSGEEHAGNVLAAFGTVSDCVYKVYVAKLWTLWHLASGDVESARPPGPFGAIVGKLAAKISDSPLVDPKAAHIRNADCHEHYRYDPNKDALGVVP